MSASSIDSSRIVAVDLMRFLAIFLMFVDHSVKLFFNFAPSINAGESYVNIARSLLLITTFSAPLFLFLVGVSAILSHSKKGQNNEGLWLKDKITRGVFFIVISFPLYLYQQGLSEFPYTSGILQLIGTSLIVVSVLLVYLKTNRSILFILLTVGIIVLDIFLKYAGIQIPILTKINFPILPYTAYVFAGSFIAEKLVITQYKKDFILKAGIASSVTVLYFLYLAKFDPLFISSTYTVVEGYIIHSTLMVLFYISLMILILSGLLIVQKYISKSYLVGQMTLIGREALNIYILHILLGWGVSKYLLQDQKFGFWSPITAIIGFTVLGWLWAKARQKGYFQFMP